MLALLRGDNLKINFAFAVLLLLGLVMVFSSSILLAERIAHTPWYFFQKQLAAVALGLLLMMVVAQIPLKLWQDKPFMLLFLCVFLLAVVLIPGIGREVNGSRRWLNMGVTAIQVSEFIKLMFTLYLASYLVRHQQEVSERLLGVLKPFVLALALGILLLAQPDFGSLLVLVGVSLGMLWVARAKISHFVLTLLGIALLLAVVAIMAPYRLQRLTSFLDPWADPFDKGFQLTQSLIAIGNGSLAGNGLGASIQKHFYLPEAHTDFIFAIYAEETGWLGVSFLVLLYLLVIALCFRLARAAMQKGQDFAAYLASGIGLWIGLQAFINMGVNLGILPTKGLTLPFISYGGSSILVLLIALGLLNRIALESHETDRQNNYQEETEGFMEVHHG